MELLSTYINSTFSFYRTATCLECYHRRLPVLIDLSCALPNKLARHCKICKRSLFLLWCGSDSLRNDVKEESCSAEQKLSKLLYTTHPLPALSEVVQPFLSLSPVSYKFNSCSFSYASFHWFSQNYTTTLQAIAHFEAFLRNIWCKNQCMNIHI